jgi:hypothetical protein
MTTTAGLYDISLKATEGRLTNKSKKASPFQCSNPFPLTCMNHGEDMAVSCGRWRVCPGCCARTQWLLKQRLIAGIENPPLGKLPMFLTLTFPQAEAPDEDGAHMCWRKLVGRLRYRGYLGAYAWVLQRQRNESLHFHGIAYLPWFNDGLAEWRQLVVKSGFGLQNKLVVAERHHAGYCAKYISTRLATLAPLRRAFAFSPGFPQSRFVQERALLAEQYGIVPEDECAWTPSRALQL